MPYQPPYTITEKSLSLVAQISELIANTTLLKGQKSSQLRKQNRIKTIITGALAIEGNTLSLAQVSAIIEGKSVRGSQKEIAEVRGAIKAYERLRQYQADSTIFIEFMLAIILSSIRDTDPVQKLLSIMNDDYLSSAQMIAKVGLSHKPTFRKNYPLLELKQALIKMSHPDTPNSPKQKYAKTQKGNQ
jgi:hypothetical protein